MVASECAPVAQAGGLGDVVFGLSRELEWRGNAVEIVLPKYDCLRYDRIHDHTVDYEDLTTRRRRPLQRSRCYAKPRIIKNFGTRFDLGGRFAARYRGRDREDPDERLYATRPVQ